MKALRAAFPGELAGVTAKDLVFVDESGVNLAMVRRYARSPRGRRAFGSAPRNWGDNVTILSALGVEGLLASMYLPGATDGAVFLTYLKKVLIPKLKGVLDLIESAGARLGYLPPYSPDFNPIELAWSQAKSHLRRVAARTRRTLARAIKEALARISPQDARGYFAHCGYHS